MVTAGHSAAPKQSTDGVVDRANALDFEAVKSLTEPPNLKTLREIRDDLSMTETMSGLTTKDRAECFCRAYLRLAQSAQRGDSAEFKEIESSALTNAARATQRWAHQLQRGGELTVGGDFETIISRYRHIAERQIETGNPADAAATLSFARKFSLEGGILTSNFDLSLRPNATDVLARCSALNTLATIFNEQSAAPELQQEIRSIYRQIAGNISARFDPELLARHGMQPFSESASDFISQKSAALALHGRVVHQLSRAVTPADELGAESVRGFVEAAVLRVGTTPFAIRNLEAISDLGHFAEHAAEKLPPGSVMRERLETLSSEVAVRVIDLGTLEARTKVARGGPQPHLEQAVCELHAATLAPERIRAALVEETLGRHIATLAPSDDRHPISDAADGTLQKLFYAWRHMQSTPDLAQRHPTIGRLVDDGMEAQAKRRFDEIL